MSVAVKKPVIIIFFVVLIIFTTILILSTISPIPLPFLSNIIRNELDNRFHAYYVDFENVRTRWRPTQGTLEFHFDTSRALDYGDNILASVPNVKAEIKINSIFKKRISVKEIKFNNPKISFVRTTGGALKFDIGNTDDGSSSRILETILIHVATAPFLSTENQQAPTNIQIHNSDLTISDEETGSLLHVPNANITLIPNTKGIACNYDFNVLARGENLHISGECLYITSNKNINLLINLDEVRPALLTEISPQFIYLTPLEVRFSGELKLVLNNLISVESIEFDLISKKGTLELTDYYGKNLDINSLHIVGAVKNNFSNIEIDNLVLDLNDTKSKANATFLRSDEILDIEINASLRGNKIYNLLPRWFNYLENDNLDCFNKKNATIDEVSFLTIDGTYNLKQHQIHALGHISCLENKNLNKKTTQDFRMDGPFNAPNLTIVQ